MKLAYVDACVWITLIEGLDEYRPPVRAALAHDGWELCTSDAVHLEVLFRPQRLKQERLCEIYRTLLDETRSLAIPQTVFADALSMATREGLKAMDAVHCTIAKHHGCGRFVTTDHHFSELKAIPPEWISLPNSPATGSGTQISFL